MKLLRAATLSVADPEAAAARYEAWLDYAVVERGVVSEDLAASWNAPASAGRAYVTLRPASGADVFLRFVHAEVPHGYRPLRTHGWAAIEICVQDVLAVNERMLRSPFAVIGPPKALEGLPTIFPMQVRGPDDEIVFLTQINGDLPEYDLPRAASLIDKLFILVLACSDLAASTRWFEDHVGLVGGRTMDIVYSVINGAFGFEADRTHPLLTMTHERDVFLELDQYPAEATPRPVIAGALPPGVAIATFLHPDLDGLPGPWITPPRPREGPLYAGRRAATLLAPDGVLVEIVEAG
jgi:catechol 2,3-dioxygenase-like lactoylglutathione lyase family enzyme